MTLVQLKDYKKEANQGIKVNDKCESILKKQREAQDKAYAKKVKNDMIKSYMKLLSKWGFIYGEKIVSSYSRKYKQLTT